MPDEITSILNMLYPSREPSPYALQSLFGFGPRESFDLLRSMKLFPTESAGAEEKLKAAKIANMLSEIGIPQRKAEVEAFVQAPKSLQFFGPQHYTTEGVATYQKPELAVRGMEARTGLTEAQIKNTLAQSGLTTAETEAIMQRIREAGRFGGPSTMEAMLKALSGAGTRALPYFQEGQGLNIPGAAAMPQSPEETLKNIIMSKVAGEIEAGKADKMSLEEQLSLLYPRVLQEAVKPPKPTAAPKYKDSGLLHPDTGKPIAGDPITAAVTYAGLAADKQIRQEWNDSKSALGIIRKQNPNITKEQMKAILAKGELRKLQADRKFMESLQRGTQQTGTQEGGE